MADCKKMARTVLVLTNNIGGLYNFRWEVIKAIVDKGYKVVISIPEDAPKASFFREIGCEVILTKFSRRGMNPFADIKLMLTYKSLMKEFRPLVVLTYTIKPNIYGGMAARVLHVPQLANMTGLGDAVENGGILQRLTVWLFKRGLDKARRVFFQNESNRDFCLKHSIVRNNYTLIPGSGVNLQHHTYQPYPSDEGKIRFLFIGRLLKDKGAEEFLETARIIKEKYPQTEFQILGSIDGDYQNRVDELVKTDVLKFLGRQLDVRPFIGAVECTIMPSYHEGMSNVNLESAANGRPVITTNVPGCRETIEDGKTGFLVQVRSSKSLTEDVEKFIALSYDDKVKMGLEARKFVERKFDRQIVVDTYLKAICEIDTEE